MSLVDATRSEATKQFTTAMWWVLGIVLAAYVAFTAFAIGLTFGAAADGRLGGDAAPLPTEGLAAMLYSIGTSIGYVFPLLIGTLMATTEYRHKTLTATFLATPKRGIALLAKVIVGIGLGVLYGAVAIVSSVLPAAVALAIFGIDTEFGSSDTWALLARMLLAAVLWVIVGLGVGALIRSQVGAIVIVLVFTQFVEPIARTAGGFIDAVANIVEYLPGAAGDALVGASIFTGFAGQSADAPEWWVGGFVLLAYAVVFGGLGYLTSWRRDIT